MTTIKQSDFIQSIADSLQHISYYHPLDYITALAAAYEREQGDIPARILTILGQAQEALSAGVIAGIIVGNEGKYAQALDPKVHEILPAVEEILAALVEQKQVIQATVRTRPTGPRAAFVLASRLAAIKASN